MRQNIQKKVCSTFEDLHDLSSNRRKPDWFLSPHEGTLGLVRKGQLRFVVIAGVKIGLHCLS